MMHEIKKLAIVVLFWNDSINTIECIKSILNEKKIKFTLILLDNNSKNKYSDQILKWLKLKKIKFKKVSSKFLISKNNKDNKNAIKVFYIKNNLNLGCGLGHNQGYKFAIKNNFSYIARIDNDMVVPQNLISNLIKRLEDDKSITALSPKVMFANNPKIIWYGGSKIGNNLKLQRECSNHICKKPDSKNYSGLINTDAIVGCASIMRTSSLKKAGLSDPDFFYGEEDIELSQRLKKNGGNLIIDLDNKIYHKVSSGVGSNWAKNIYYNYKYRLVLIKKIGTLGDKFFGYGVFILKLLMMFILSFKKKYSSKLVQIIYAGVHFYKNQYGNHDRKNFKNMDIFFSKINKKTSFKSAVSLLFSDKKI